MESLIGNPNYLESLIGTPTSEGHRSNFCFFFTQFAFIELWPVCIGEIIQFTCTFLFDIFWLSSTAVVKEKTYIKTKNIVDT